MGTIKFFKYMNDNGAKCFLNHLTIRFSSPTEYNDPFELSPEFYISNQDVSEGYDLNFSIDIEKKELIYERYLMNSDSLGNNLWKMDNNDYIEQIASKVGFSCFTAAETEIPHNLLMWAHYGESHKGIAIEFKKGCKLLDNAIDINYLSKRPIINIKMLTQNNDIGICNFYFKSADWRYENEKRIVMSLNECTNGIYEINPDDIERVYVGCNASKDLKILAIKINKDKKIPFSFLTPHKQEYKLIPYAVFDCDINNVVDTQYNLLFDRDKR